MGRCRTISSWSYHVASVRRLQSNIGCDAIDFRSFHKTKYRNDESLPTYYSWRSISHSNSSSFVFLYSIIVFVFSFHLDKQILIDVLYWNIETQFYRVSLRLVRKRTTFLSLQVHDAMHRRGVVRKKFKWWHALKTSIRLKSFNNSLSIHRIWIWISA